MPANNEALPSQFGKGFIRNSAAETLTDCKLALSGHQVKITPAVQANGGARTGAGGLSEAWLGLLVPVQAEPTSGKTLLASPVPLALQEPVA